MKPLCADRTGLLAGEERITTPRVGWIESTSGGVLLVDFPGNPRGPLSARATVPIDPTLAIDAAAPKPGALLLFEGGDPARPLVVGLLQPPLPTLVDLMLGEGGAVARVDGRRVELEGQDEVVLRCGEASITLRRNGRIVIRGTSVESHATGTNRIKGGSVRIN